MLALLAALAASPILNICNAEPSEPIRKSNERYSITDEQYLSETKYTAHDLQYVHVKGNNQVFLLAWGKLYYNNGANERSRRVGPSVMTPAHLVDRTWRSNDRFSEFGTNGELQSDPIVRAIVSAITFVTAGGVADNALRDTRLIAKLPPLANGAADLSSWYTCQSCVKGGDIIKPQVITSVTFRSVGAKIYLHLRGKRDVLAIIDRNKVAQYEDCGPSTGE
jgi:hypothetical protein